MTSDEQRIHVMLNAGLSIDLKHLKNADAVGLYRTEIPFMMRNKLPSVQEQTELYSNIFRLAGNKSVIFRTLDIGGDKTLPYMPYKQGENPAMGWRAVRVSIDRPLLLKQQIRAIIRAANGKPVSILIPMIATVEEYKIVREMIDTEIQKQFKKGYAKPRFLKCGAMIEVPSIIFELDKLLKLVDFVSVGSNDLHQFFFAADRSMSKIIDRYDTLSPEFLNLLKSIIDKCNKFNKPIIVCGEMAGQPLEVLALIGLGYRRFSMTPSSLKGIRALLKDINTQHIAAFLKEIISKYPVTIRHTLRNFARDNGHNII
jgi:phosphotransferase system enzyme I (PtsP)